MTLTPAQPPFTPDLCLAVARQAASMAGLRSGQAELVRIGEHAIVRLPGEVIARIARRGADQDAAGREVRLAQALISAGVPCIRPYDCAQPLLVEGHPVTLWAEIPGPISAPTMADFGQVLRQLHDADSALSYLELPPLDPWSHMPERIEQAEISEPERTVLREVLADVRQAWTDLEFSLGVGLIHGDAHLGNVACGADGSRALLDLGSICIGPREFDLAPIGTYVTSLGWLTPADYQQFVAAYGYDVTRSPAFPVLRRQRELRMTTWMTQHVAESNATAAEVSHRIACLADDTMPRRWSPR